MEKSLEDLKFLKVKGKKLLKWGKTSYINNIDARFIGISKISSNYLNKLKLFYKNN